VAGAHASKAAVNARKFERFMSRGSFSARERAVATENPVALQEHYGVRKARRDRMLRAKGEAKMRYLNPATAAISVGAVFGVWHLMWVALVATGVAKPIMDLVLKLHFIQLDYTLAPFALSTALTLVGLTFGIGAVLGLVFALVWNWLSVRSEAIDVDRAFNSR
jgi:hypothetical protein